ncbi:MAG: alpha/beta fold hydrolase [Actinobacteria bacterium]|nr:alpha/beta fold hydrolase [Actinomycetota bacterium]
MKQSPAEEQDDVVSFDGTRLAARRTGEGSPTPLLIINAVGTSTSVWRRIAADVARERPVITWDLRGLNYSELPRSDRIDPSAHVEDAVAVTDHFGAEQVAVAAWSTGTRIALEFAAAYPDRTRALTLVNGGYGHALRRLRFLEFASLLPVGAGLTKYVAGFLESPFRNVTRRPEFAGLIRQSGAVGPTADIPGLVEMAHEVADSDLHQLLSTYSAIAGDGAPELLEQVQAQTLLVAGGRDQITSMRMMEKMAARIPGARLEVFDEATHYLPFEFASRLSEALRKFLSETEPLDGD